MFNFKDSSAEQIACAVEVKGFPPQEHSNVEPTPLSLNLKSGVHLHALCAGRAAAFECLKLQMVSAR